MCGIAGAVGLPMEIDAAALGNRLAHRGPDDAGWFSEGAVVLVHRRLAIVDLSPAGHQPMVSSDERYAMVYNGEIYNHRDLRETRLAGHQFRGASDSETLLELYAREGEACLARLNGIFAAAIWDRRERTLTLVRDGAGVKPLYLWRRRGGGLGFASEIKALLALPGFGSGLDPVAVAAYVSFLWSPGERTMFADVTKLEAGTWLRVNQGGAQVAAGRFYALPAYEPAAMDAQSAIAGTGHEVAQAVERQMLADVEVGAFLSGGLDSTAIVHFARAGRGAMNCFTLDYGADNDEMVSDLPFARRAAAHLGVRLHEVAITPQMAQDLPALVEMLDEPQADPAALGNYYISRAASDRGIKVLLSGSGGDDVFTGYRRHRQFGWDGAVGRIPAALRRAALSLARGAAGGSDRGRLLVKLLGGAQGGADERLRRAFEWLPLESAAALVAARPDPAVVAGPFAAALGEQGPGPAVERLLRLDQRFFLRDHNLNYVDKTGMAAGVEIRVPFLDPQLMAFAARIPLTFKLRRGQTKWVLRKAMEPYLPHEVIYRPKAGFGVPLRSWMKGPLRPLIGDLTAAEVVARRGVLDPGAVAALRDAHFAGRIDAAYPLLAVAMIELWCRSFIDEQ